jgi:predicted RNA-binding protein
MSLALVKEDGTGMADANAYADVADGNAYHDGHLYASAWAAASADQKTVALVIRDTALAAVQGLAPSGKSKIDSVMIIGREMEKKEFATLTPMLRKNVREWLHKPIISSEFAEFGGVVREIDLDLHRITIRRLEGMKIEEIRCIYTEDKIPNARDYVDKSVIVAGKVQRDNLGNPRLLQVENLRLKNAVKSSEAQLL